MIDISRSFTHKMAAKINWHRYGTKLRHCHSIYNSAALMLCLAVNCNYARKANVRPEPKKMRAKRLGRFCVAYRCTQHTQTQTDHVTYGIHYGPITIAIRARFEYDSSTIRLRFGYNTLQHATRFFVRSHTRSYTRISGRRVLHVD